MTQEEIDFFLKDNNITVSVMWEEGYDKDGEYVDKVTDDEGNFKSHGEDAVKIERMWGFSSPNGFHTFDFAELEEKEAQYLTVVFHKLYEEYDTSWNDAEVLAYSYVYTCTVPFEPHLEPHPPLSEEEQEKVRQKLLGCIESGNVVIPENVVVPEVVLPPDDPFDAELESWQSEVDAKNDQDEECYEDFEKFKGDNDA